jgi:hypothetical protein
MRAKKMRHNGNGTVKTSNEKSADEKQLSELLQKAVNKEKAPESLREKIRRMIRE